MGISILATRENGLTQQEAIKQGGVNILTNLEHDVLLSGDGYKPYKSAYWAWTGTNIQYEKGSTTAYVWNEGEKKKTKIFLPLQDGWYLVNNKYGIPNGEPSQESNPKARKLWRWQDRDYSGLVSRCDDLFGNGRRGVGCYDYGGRGGVLVHDRAKRGTIKPDAAMVWLKKIAKKNKNAKEILKRLK